MRLRPLLPVLACAATAVIAAPAASQSFSDPGLGFGAHVLLSKGRAAEDASLAGGLHLRYRPTASLGLEGRIGFRRETVDDGSGPLLELLELPLTGTAQVFFLPRTRVQPFLLGGAGLHVVKWTPKGRNTAEGGATEALFALHAGAGLDVRPSRSSAVHLDGRWVFLEPTAVADLEKAGFPTRPGYLSITLGVTFFR